MYSKAVLQSYIFFKFVKNYDMKLFSYKLREFMLEELIIHFKWVDSIQICIS